MFKKELTAALVVVGVLTPFVAKADQPIQEMQPEFLEGEKIKEGQLSGGYNRTASYAGESSFGMSITADYLYWKLSEDMPPIASLITVTSPIPITTAAAVFNGTGKAVFLNPTYKTGFQVGVGLDLKGLDDWNLYAEYTWYQNKAQSSVTAGSGELLVIDPSITPNKYRSLTSRDLSTTFRLHYNAVDLAFQRAFYVGKRLTTTLGMGLRGLWISQKFNAISSGLSYFETGEVFLTPEPGFLDVKRELKSWALGPRVALESKWLLGLGFRLVGDLSTSVLYTRYTEKDNASISVLSHILVSQASNYNTLRAVTETSLGLGWGAYLGESSEYHLDFLASYAFNVFWNQSIASMNGNAGNFYLQGLNLAVRFDF